MTRRWIDGLGDSKKPHHNTGNTHAAKPGSLKLLARLPTGRCSPTERTVIRMAAKGAGMKESTWLRQVAVTEARRQLKEREDS